jgi:C1A family cysteine protease
MWVDFKRTYDKAYETPEEERMRREIFVSNLALIDERNVLEAHAGGSAMHGITQFMDLAPQEFADRYLTAKKTERSNATKAPRLPELTQTISQDWTGTYTTAVKNQGYCGSCWAFSATEQIESDVMRTLGTTYTLSPAQIAQCDATAFGCGGGWTEHAYSYVSRAGGIETESNYPYPDSMFYTGTTGSCSSNSKDFVVTVDNYYSVSGESQMASYVGSTGPLSVCLDASSWSSYTGGILKVCGNSVDHCVQAVGVNTGSNGYWKVRNSWGTSWGESGYIRLAYGSNTCDITNDPTYTKVSLV